MNSILQFFKKYFFFSSSSNQSLEELQAGFKKRYRNFRALLTANNNTLETMAEMEQVLQAGRSYSMAFVRSRSTAVMVNVYKMVRHLIEMSDGRYHGLEKSFEKIKSRVEEAIDRQAISEEGEWVLPLHRINKNIADQVGEKMANLGEVAAIEGLQTPSGFAITASATRYFFDSNNIQPEINRFLQMLDPDNLESLYTTSAEIQTFIANSILPRDLEEQILSSYRQLENKTESGVQVAMRSSALGEDLAGASFAGQYNTELNVDSELLGRTYKEIVASKYTSRAIIYRLKRGFRDEDITMCVGCLAMVDAVISGVIYSRDPAFLNSTWVNINVASGSAQHVVDGTEATDCFLVTREEPHRILEEDLRRTEKNSKDKTGQQFNSETGPVDRPISQTLTHEQASLLAQFAVILEDHFGTPQDIEWSIDRHGDIKILQSRPLIPAAGDQEREEVVFDTDEEDRPILRGGVTGSPGVACGPVFLVRSTIDMLQFPLHAVLVVEHPLPEWAPLLNRAVAMIAETGSEAGHLATVSREFGLPALLAVQHATEKLKNGEIVTVDATGRMVHGGCREELLVNAVNPPDLMAGSPVQRSLQEVLQWITPLNLTDPGSPYFKATWCETLHDITRFCHEKSVAEMFSFGEKFHFNERAAKRLIGDVPMEWWVIDLDDGFSEKVEATDKTVQLNDILSLPMLSFWEGMSAFPWQGPPPVNVKGMGSILFQSTMNPALDPAVASPMTAKNYFLVSKKFCNLNVRLGYHLAMMEAYLSDLLTESYVSFNFKGGAADDKRKAARIQLLEEVLAQFAFRVEKKGDSMTARVEKKPIGFLVERLRILGYLTLHTRQIDMVLGNQNTFRQYKEKFLTEINTLLDKPEDINP